MACPSADPGWVVYVIERQYGLQEWYFWRAELSGWVSDLARATLYPTEGVAVAVAEEQSREEGIDARVIRRSQVV